MRLANICLLILISLCFPGKALALWCTNGSQTVQYNGDGGTITVSIDPPSLTKQSLNLVLTDMNSYAKCNGSINTTYEDAMRANSLVLSPELTKLGFSGYIINSNGVKINPVANTCLWPDGNCSVKSWAKDTTAILNAKIGIERTSGSGIWKTGTTLAAGTQIAKIEAQYRYGGGNASSVAWKTLFNWSFVLKKPMVIPAYTCTISQYDKTVTLEKMDRTKIIRNGAGRYSEGGKDFTIELACEAGTAIDVTFEGLPLAGTDNVLKNVMPGNENIGIQLSYLDSTPIKFDTKYALVSNAGKAEKLKLNASYYYKGGSVNIGPVKSNTTFTFDYR